jgi:adenylate kinase
MRLILLGPPGSGKGTQAKQLSRNLKLEHIGTGDILRAAVRELTEVGRRAKPFVESGRLVPDDLVNDLVAERFHRSDRPSRFVLDGYPRTVAQAEAFNRLLRELGVELTAVVHLDVADEEIVRRVGKRWSCPRAGCKATYHTESNPPRKPGICDDCGTALVQREDDRPETVRERLKVYHKDTVELIPYYKAQGLLHEVPAEGDIEQVYENIVKVLQPLAGRKC